MGDDMPQSEVSDTSDEQQSPLNHEQPRNQMYQNQGPQVEEQKEIYDYKNMRN